MKKLVTILGSIGLIATTGITVVACKMPIELKQKLEDSKKEKSKTEKQTETPETKPKKTEHNEEQPKASEKPQNDNEHNSDDTNYSNNGNSANNYNSELQPQGDDPRVTDGTSKRTKEQNFDLIKNYGFELSEILNSLEDRFEEIDDNGDNDSLKIAVALANSYKNIMQYSNFSEFEKALREKVKDSIGELTNRIEKEWEEVVDQYIKEKDNILGRLKSYTKS
ncbi:lipoprotein [Mycoplasma feriruminatoris]|uniref:lipoprotein n=1 Tax=Mycoplasma feriruminatoris TaxID=1179777 RepID=UPI00241EAE1A|nr:lipoprotein [Mycoplasma feriruminatoris]WFQ94500.1 hypothetical protein MFERI15220_00581 [Mycoplasma feriruminatoris]